MYRMVRWFSLCVRTQASNSGKDNTTSNTSQESMFKKFLPPSEDGEEDGPEFKVFKSVFSTINFDSMPAYVASIRKRSNIPRQRFSLFRLFRAANPVVQTPALFGSIHMSFVIAFPDGYRLLLKIPGTGYRDQFTELEAQSLVSEARAMRVLKSQTTLAVPDVYDFSSSCDNPLNCPFILMEYMAGTSSLELWFDKEASPNRLENIRETILKEVACAMHQLNKFKFAEGGSPIFNANGKPAGVEPWKQLDFNATWKQLVSDDDTDNQAIYLKTGPFPTPASYLRSQLADTHPDPDDISQGCHQLLNMFIDWVSASTLSSSSEENNISFVLTHADLNLQNILVSPDGHVLGLIDWDGMVAAPRCLGNERYPEWLLDDWNPMFYYYQESADSNEERKDTCHHVNSPAELTRYRSMYERFVLEAAAQDPAAGGEVAEAAEDLAKLTRNSLIIASLKKAAEENVCMIGIVMKIYNEITRFHTDGEVTDSYELPYDDGLRLYQITEAMEKDELGEGRIQWIKDGFLGLFA